MQLDFAILAKGAELNRAGGSVHIFGGGFDTVLVPELPGILGPFTLMVRLVDQGVVGVQGHRLGLRGVNPDNEESALIDDLEFKFKEPQPGRTYSFATITIQIGFRAH